MRIPNCVLPRGAGFPTVWGEGWPVHMLMQACSGVMVGVAVTTGCDMGVGAEGWPPRVMITEGRYVVGRWAKVYKTGTYGTWRPGRFVEGHSVSDIPALGVPVLASVVCMVVSPRQRRRPTREWIHLRNVHDYPEPTGDMKP